MHWAKTRSAAKYNLAMSDLLHYPLSDLSVRFEGLILTGSSGYGYKPLVEAIARQQEVTADCVVETLGASMANHVAMATMIEPGDEVVLEHPTYDLLLSTARYLRADIKRFPRRFEQNFSVDCDELRRVVTPKTKLIVITNLHNPSSAFTDETTLKEIGEIAARSGARVLVDEVYLDAVFNKRPRSAFHLGNQFISTNSLTKVYGLSGLRCGWILAEPSLAQQMWRLIDLHYSTHVHISEQLSVVAFAQLETIRTRSERLLNTNKALVTAFFASHQDFSAPPVMHGLVVFPRLLSGDVDWLCTLLREKHHTTIVPGKFFEMEQHVRIGLGQESTRLTQGLENIAAALGEMTRRDI